MLDGNESRKFVEFALNIPAHITEVFSLSRALSPLPYVENHSWPNSRPCLRLFLSDIALQ